MHEGGDFPLLDPFLKRSKVGQKEWFAYLMPNQRQEEVTQLLEDRRYVILQGPPGTGKTHLAGEILGGAYKGFGKSIQFHPNTTYESFVGGLAPVPSDDHSPSLGFPFCPLRCPLM